MSLVKISIPGDAFEKMSEKDLEIFNLGMNLMGMGEDHPHYASDLEKLNKMLEENNG